jgi:cyclopropane fatty-acyl-phospholipid synthase-like methyltransferase
MEDLEQLGQRLLVATEGLRWPEERLQLQYTGASGARSLSQAMDFINLLANHVPALRTGKWHGLDFGVGWGRLASLMTAYGPPEQLDCVDAWEISLERARACGLQNRMAQVPPVLSQGDLPGEGYDFIYAYSIFTHLSKINFAQNLRVLSDALKPGGVLLFTVREPAFLEFLQRINKCKPKEDAFESDGYWFGNAQSEYYGDTVVTSDWLARNIGPLGKLERLGKIPNEVTQIVMKLVP